jgi:RNA polymerase sigma factor (sigma-70 family)
MTMQPFETIVAEHGPVVLRVCRALLGPVDAEDAWAETFLAALEAYPRLRPDSNIRGWLVTIAHRKAVDQLRAAARAPQPVAELPETLASDDTLGDAERFHEDNGLWVAIEALPFKQRGAVAYHYLAELPYAEVGALLQTSEAAARRSAADGIAKLRKIYLARS